MKRATLVFAALALVFLVAGSASAGTITLSNSGQGWINNGNHGSNGNSPTNNYIAGNCGIGDCNAGEFRDFFQFSIPSLPGTVTSADLVLYTASTLLSQSPSLDYQVTSLPVAFGFNDLGTGTFYAMRTYTSADTNTTVSIPLDAAALSAILAAEGGTFGVGGRVTSPTTFDPNAPDQAVFGSSGGSRQQLVITYNSVPEPTSLLLLGTGLLGAVGAIRRKIRL